MLVYGLGCMIYHLDTVLTWVEERKFRNLLIRIEYYNSWTVLHQKHFAENLTFFDFYQLIITIYILKIFVITLFRSIWGSTITH